jgi:hypothetical protein
MNGNSLMRRVGITSLVAVSNSIKRDNKSIFGKASSEGW